MTSKQRIVARKHRKNRERLKKKIRELKDRMKPSKKKVV
jgi:hypothetical protein